MSGLNRGIDLAGQQGGPKLSTEGRCRGRATLRGAGLPCCRQAETFQLEVGMYLDEIEDQSFDNGSPPPFGVFDRRTANARSEPQS
jgi:hypothetical protein